MAIPIRYITDTWVTSTIVHEELTTGPGVSPESSSDLNSSRATRVLMCNWADRHTLRKELLGFGVLGAFETKASYDFTIGQRNPHAAIVNAGRVREFPVQVDITPFRAAGSGAEENEEKKPEVAYEKAILTVNYEAMPFDIPVLKNFLSLVLEESYDIKVEFRTLPGRHIWWDAEKTLPLAKDESPGHQIRTAEWTYKIKNIPFIPNDVYDLAGKVNNVDMVSPIFNFTFLSGTVLYEAPIVSQNIDYEGFTTFDITYSFAVYEPGWNKGFRAGSGVPQLMYDNAGEIFKTYPEDNLNKLLLSGVELGV